MPQYFKSSIIEGFVDLAKEKNLLPELVEKQTLKTASTNSQDNLSSDNQILSLIESMHDRGMFVQAENLSQSFMSYKQAQSAYKSDYSVLLTAAHPDGDARVSESGVFHTLESTQEAMLAALQKKASLIGMVSEALKPNVSMTKKADEPKTDGKEDGEPGAFFGDQPGGDAPGGGKKDDKEAIDLDLAGFDLETKKKLEKVREKIEEVQFSDQAFVNKTSQDITAQLEALKKINFETAIISDAGIAQLYCKANGLDLAKAKEFLTRKNKAFDEGDPATQATALGNLIIQHAANEQPVVSKFPEYYKTYFTGMVVNPGDKDVFIKRSESDPAYWENPQSIFDFVNNWWHRPLIDTDASGGVFKGVAYKINNGRAVSVAKTITSEYSDQYNSFIGEDKSGRLVGYVVGVITPIISSLVASSNSPIPNSPGLTSAACYKAQDYLRGILKMTNKVDANVRGILGPQFSFIYSCINSLFQSKGELLSFVTSKENAILSEDGDKVVNTLIPDAQKNGWSKIIATSIRQWTLTSRDTAKNSKLKETDPDAIYQKGIAEGYARINEALESSKTIGEFSTKVGMKFESIADVEAMINGIQESINTVKKSSSISKDLFKKADAPVPPAPPVPPVIPPAIPGYSKPTPEKGNKPPTGQQPKPQNKPSGNSSTGFNVNVQTMQFAIQQYAATLLKNKKASDLAVSKMLSVGPKGSSSPANMDGVWGSQTAAALETSNEHIQGKPLVVRPTSLDADAKKNTEILVAAKNYVDGYSGGASPGGVNNPELDHIEFGMNSDFGYTVIDGEKVLHSSDLNSLKSLYSFLYNNDLVSAIGEENERGYTIKMWGQILNVLSKRAEEQEAKANSSVKANAAAKFKSKIKNLMLTWRQYLMSNFNGATLGKENFIISQQFLSSSGLAGNYPSSNSGNEFSSPGGKQNSRGNKGSGKSSLDGETYDVGGGSAGYSSVDKEDGDPTVLPFTRTINFGNPWWRNTAIAQEYPGQYISIKGFAGGNATTRAQMMFSNDENMPSAQDLQEQYIVSHKGELRLDQDKNWDGETYWVFVAGGDRNSIQLNRYPNFKKNFGIISNKTILNKYRNYLQMLKQGLTSSYQSWMSSEPAESAIEQVQHYHQRWVEAINNQVDQINRTFQNYQ